METHILPRFVLLEHDYPQLHWDFMLEDGDRLLTWKLLEDPAVLVFQQLKLSGVSVKSALASDHRLVYLGYEGPVSGGRGWVKRFDYGAFDWIQKDYPEIQVKLRGEKLKGIFVLTELSFTIV